MCFDISLKTNGVMILPLKNHQATHWFLSKTGASGIRGCGSPSQRAEAQKVTKNTLACLLYIGDYMDVSKNRGTQNGWFIM